MNEWKKDLKEGWMKGWMNEWMNEWMMNEWIPVYEVLPTPKDKWLEL